VISIAAAAPGRNDEQRGRAEARGNLASPVSVEFPADAIDVVPHSGNLKAESRGDLLVGQRSLHEARNLCLAGGKGGWDGIPLEDISCRIDPADEGGSDPWRAVELPGDGVADRADEVLWTSVVRDEAREARFEEREQLRLALVAVHCQKGHGRVLGMDHSKERSHPSLWHIDEDGLGSNVHKPSERLVTPVAEVEWDDSVLPLEGTKQCIPVLPRVDDDSNARQTV